MISASRQVGGRGSRAFTLIELLVVIAIITLLIGILLPALSRARELGRIAVCANNMRSMAQAHVAYTNEYKGELVGSPATSGIHAVETVDIPVQFRARSRRLQNISSAGGVQPTFNGVAVQNWDHYGPLAAFMGKEGPGDQIAEGPLPQSSSGAVEQVRGQRFDWLRRLEEFRCPNNVRDVQLTDPRVLGSGARLAQIGPGPIISYQSSTQFVAVPRANGGAQTNDTQFFAGQSSRGIYFPRIERVGLAANKLMFMEGARFSDSSRGQGLEPTLNTQLSATAGGAFADNGAWTRIGRILDRATAPGEDFRQEHLNDPRRYPDNRSFAFRHNVRRTSGAIGEVDGNLVFFDGHVELRSDRLAGEPNIWFPTNSTFTETQSNAFWNATRLEFANQGANATTQRPYVVP